MPFCSTNFRGVFASLFRYDDDLEEIVDPLARELLSRFARPAQFFSTFLGPSGGGESTSIDLLEIVPRSSQIDSNVYLLIAPGLALIFGVGSTKRASCSFIRSFDWAMEFRRILGLTYRICLWDAVKQSETKKDLATVLLFGKKQMNVLGDKFAEMFIKTVPERKY